MGSARQRALAWFLARSMRRYESMVRPQKQTLFDGVGGIVLEIGPGTGPNLPYLRSADSYVGIEPNPYMHRHLRKQIDQAGVRGEILGTSAAEAFAHFADGSVDFVVCTLVLCSIQSPSEIIAAAHRVLRPGGRFLFLEHVGAPHGTALCWCQRICSPAFALLGDGCDPTRDTAATLRASPFAHHRIDQFRLPIGPISPHISGWLQREATGF